MTTVPEGSSSAPGAFVLGAFVVLASCVAWLMASCGDLTGPRDPSELRLTSCASFADRHFDANRLAFDPDLIGFQVPCGSEVLDCSVADQEARYEAILQLPTGWKDPLDLVEYRRCVEREG